MLGSLNKAASPEFGANVQNCSDCLFRRT
jgi:hypothetical protein